MAPEYDKLVDIVKEKREDVIIARLEGSLNEDISLIFEIFSFPKIVMFYPGSVDIRSNFRGQRMASVLFTWIEQNAPKLEKQNLKMLQDENTNNSASLDEVEKIRNFNKTLAYDLEDAVHSGKNYTGEIEFLKIEMLNMKNRIINLEKDIEDLKNHTINSKNNQEKNNQNDMDINFNSNKTNFSEEDLAMKLKLIKEKKRLTEGFFDKISSFDIFIYFGIVLILIAAIITIKKILFKRNKNNFSNDHVKV